MSSPATSATRRQPRRRATWSTRARRGGSAEADRAEGRSLQCFGRARMVARIAVRPDGPEHLVLVDLIGKEIDAAIREQPFEPEGAPVDALRIDGLPVAVRPPVARSGEIRLSLRPVTHAPQPGSRLGVSLS